MVNYILIDRKRYDQMMECTPKKAFNRNFLLLMDMVGILDETGTITLLKNRIDGRRQITKIEWDCLLGDF